MTDNKKWITLIPAAVGLLLAVGAMTVFSACGPKEDGTWMKCHQAQIAVAVCGIALAVLFALTAVVKSKTAVMLLNVAALVISVIAFLIPGILMPMCMMKTMPCYTAMQPFVRIMAILSALLAGWGILREFKN